MTLAFHEIPLQTSAAFGLPLMGRFVYRGGIPIFKAGQAGIARISASLHHVDNSFYFHNNYETQVMKKIEGFVGIAPKTKSGEVEYCLWSDPKGALLIQIIRNITKTDHPGTHSTLLFRISDYLNSAATPNEMAGFNPRTFAKETSRNKDDFGFVKAILKHLFP